MPINRYIIQVYGEGNTLLTTHLTNNLEVEARELVRRYFVHHFDVTDCESKTFESFYIGNDPFDRPEDDYDLKWFIKPRYKEELLREE